MQTIIDKTPIKPRRLFISGQKGISLIPALITICIFTLLTTQVIVPNQIRNANDVLISSLVNSAEKIEQASLAFYANNGAWPTSIETDLIPDYLPAFTTLTDTGFSWTLVEIYTNKGNGTKTYNPKAKWSTPPSFADPVTGEMCYYIHGCTYSMTLILETGDRKLAESLINKIGGHVILSGTTPDGYSISTGSQNWDVVEIPLIAPATNAIDSLRIVNDITIGGNIVLTGQVMAQDGATVLFDASATPTASATSETGHYHSSKRFKHNIQPLDRPAESIYQLKPVSFDYVPQYQQYKTNNAAKTEIGLIAEQVLPLAPELTLIKDDKVIGVDYQKLSILVLKAVQELKTEVIALQQGNQQLQKQIEALDKSRINQISSQKDLVK
ncbi:MAG: tail fiber domain-containing protein [Porticoccaceae bacterium]|nr:tail fiber domain-containing protein [Porticoccaceae bacterium]